jgi:hypothetical protein
MREGLSTKCSSIHTYAWYRREAQLLRLATIVASLITMYCLLSVKNEKLLLKNINVIYLRFDSSQQLVKINYFYFFLCHKLRVFQNILQKYVTFYLTTEV